MIKNSNHDYVEAFETVYFGLKVRAFTTQNTLKFYSSFPWTYEIEHNGKLITFHGIPNMRETKRSALKKAYYRAKWLDEDTFNTHYYPN